MSIYSQLAESIAKQTSKAADDGNLDNSVSFIIDAVIVMLGVVAVIIIILGAITYATSQGDPGKVKKGKDTILYGIIGLVVALSAFAIVTFVIKST